MYHSKFSPKPSTNHVGITNPVPPTMIHPGPVAQHAPLVSLADPFEPLVLEVRRCVCRCRGVLSLQCYNQQNCHDKFMRIVQHHHTHPAILTLHDIINSIKVRLLDLSKIGWNISSISKITQTNAVSNIMNCPKDWLRQESQYLLASLSPVVPQAAHTWWLEPTNWTSKNRVFCI